MGFASTVVTTAHRLIDMVTAGKPAKDGVDDEAGTDHPIDDVDVALCDLANADETAGRGEVMSDSEMARYFPNSARRRRERRG